MKIDSDEALSAVNRITKLIIIRKPSPAADQSFNQE